MGDEPIKIELSAIETLRLSRARGYLERAGEELQRAQAVFREAQAENGREVLAVTRRSGIADERAAVPLAIREFENGVFLEEIPQALEGPAARTEEPPLPPPPELPPRDAEDAVK